MTARIHTAPHLTPSLYTRMDFVFLSSRIINPNAGIAKHIKANALIAGCTTDKPVAINVGSTMNIENNFLLLRNIFGKYLRGKNIQSPVM
ncbi:GSCOCG00000142001-RA-CDS [Cotesia congregata]|nr:GSCOCG00000142001-RA-CDS [Cotesia congregata]